jgi:hypothetical protein
LNLVAFRIQKRGRFHHKALWSRKYTNPIKWPPLY